MHITPEWPFPSKNNMSVKGIFFRIQLTEKSGRFETSTADSYFAS